MDDAARPDAPRSPPVPAAPPVPPPPPSPPLRAGDESDARMWAAFAHLGGLLTLIGVPGILGSLGIWLWKRGDSALIDEHGKEAVNFQITVLIYSAVAAVIAFVTCGLGMIVVAPLLLVLSVLIIVLPIIATIKASDGRPYRYPLTIRLID